MTAGKKVTLQAIALLFGAIVFFGAVKDYTVNAFNQNVPKWSLASLNMSQNSFIFDQGGQKIGELYGRERRHPVRLEAIPRHTIQALVATEDARFYRHYGVDPQAILRALCKDVALGSMKEGGSTITQQLIKNSILSPERTLARKIKEAMIAIDMERKLSKRKILELYLNRVYFGHGAYGIGAASYLYFDKAVDHLTVTESAMLVGMIRNPTGYSPILHPEATTVRVETVLQLMHQQGFLAQNQFEEAMSSGYKIVNRSWPDLYKYPFYLDYVVDEAMTKLGFTPKQIFEGGLRINTTLDTKVQGVMEAEVENPNNFPPRAADGVEVQGAVVLLEPATGAIKGLVGGRDYVTRRGYNRAYELVRQPGSTFKPLAAYGPALEAKYPPNTVMTDTPVSFGRYSPQNFGGHNRGELYLQEALKYSVNVYAVKLLQKVGIERGWEFAKATGIPLVEADKGLSLALGGLTKGVSPLQMGAAYSAFANGGYRVEPHAIESVYDSEGKCLFKAKYKKKQIMKPQTAYLMTKLLQEVVQGGTGTRARIAGCQVAGKTGTTQLPDTPEFQGLSGGNKDAWFVGYTPQLLGAVWMGYDHTDREHYLRGIFGGTYPAHLWQRIMSQVVLEAGPRQFPAYQGNLVYRQDVRTQKTPAPAAEAQQSENKDKDSGKKAE